MKTLLPLLVLLLPQDSHTLAWSPPEGKVVVVKASASSEGPDYQASFTSEIELHPAEDGVSVHVQRLVLNEKKEGKAGGFTYERGKKPVWTGEAKAEDLAGVAETLEKDPTASISRDGNFDKSKSPSLALFVGLGLVEKALPPDGVRAGSTWTGKVRIPLSGPDFSGTLAYKLESVEAGKAARISVKVAEQGVVEGEDKLKWHGSGTMVFSLADRLVTEFKFAMELKSEDGKIVKSFKQEVAASLKP
jgi:hypothetical protein